MIKKDGGACIGCPLNYPSNILQNWNQFFHNDAVTSSVLIVKH